VKVSLHPSDNTGCGEYRMRLPAAAAAAEGVDVDIIDRRAPVTFVEHQGGIGAQARDPETDVVVLQRVCSRRIADLVPVIQQLGQAVVVDIDDDLTCIQANHPAFAQFSPTRNPDVNWRHLQRACAQADLVTVPTEVMARRYGAHGRQVARGRNREARFDHVHAQLFQLTRQLQLFLRIHGKAGGLLSVSQRRVKNVDVFHADPFGPYQCFVCAARSPIYNSCM